MILWFRETRTVLTARSYHRLSSRVNPNELIPGLEALASFPAALQCCLQPRQVKVRCVTLDLCCGVMTTVLLHIPHISRIHLAAPVVTGTVTSYLSKHSGEYSGMPPIPKSSKPVTSRLILVTPVDAPPDFSILYHTYALL